MTAAVDPYISMADLAKALKWRTQKVRRWMLRAGIAELVGGHWKVADDRLRERFPPIFERYYAYRVLHPREGQRSAAGGR